ncbi:MAG TPA: phospholipase D-like domain-containing protein, partial [Vicinamibacterales bacterium]|nr:phospholipase D-like domain-containing protein [Vicinamibacterales bacterium]
MLIVYGRVRFKLWFFLLALGTIAALSAPAAAAPLCSGPDCVYFTQTDSVSAALVNAINAETVRIDMSTWYFDDSNVYTALVNRMNAGVPVRLIGDRGSIFEADPHTKSTFEYLASLGMPIRLRYNPNWYPEIDHWKATMFVGQGLVEFGSPNYTVFELAPFSSTNYNDENALFTTDPTLFDAMESKFDQYWNDTKAEPESLVPNAPYFKNWNDACALESNCADYATNYPNPKPMVIDTARLFPDYTAPADLIFGQGSDFNNRLITEINNENTAIDMVVYRMTVANMASAILAKFQAGVGVRLMIEPNEYINRVYPEFWLTHANLDTLWAAGVPMMQRLHAGNTHMKTMVTSTYATVASSNFMASWQRDHDYFLSAATKPDIYQAIKANFEWMWANSNNGYTAFVPGLPDSPSLVGPASGAGSVTTTPTLTWDIAAFATNYDVYLWPSSGSKARVANVSAILTPSPPSTYSWTATTALQCNTTYDWEIVSRTNATPRNANLIAASTVQQFTTGGTNCGGTGGGGPVPSPWTNQDIGSTGRQGSASYASGVFTVSGSGADIWGNTDAFQFVSQAQSGDGTIIARVSSEQNTSVYAKAGVMVRQSLTGGSAHVILDATPGGGIEFMTRSTTGGETTSVASATASFPVWLKLAITGSTVTGSISSNGTTWTTVGSTTTTMTASTNIGLIVTSHDTTKLNTSTFDNVSVGTGSGGGGGGGTAVPSPWVSQDVGSTGDAGSATFASGVFTVKGSGADIWGSADAFQYVYQPVTSDQTIVARVTSEQNTSAYAKAGVMMRQSTSASDAQVILDVTPSGGIEFMTRATSGGQVAFIAGGTQAFPAWLQLSRSGSTITASTSANGTTWTTIGSTATSMTSSVDVGLIVTSHDTTQLNTSTFDNVSVTASGPPPPPPPPAANVVVYAGDVATANIHGSWQLTSDSTAAGGMKLASTDAGVSNTTNALATPTDYVDVTFNANAGTPYTLWMRVEAANDNKFNDSFYVQFSDASANGSSAYPIGTTSGLVVNLAPDSTGNGMNNWGWADGAYWLSQSATFTFPTTGAHSMRVQVREDGVEFDQI